MTDHQPSDPPIPLNLQRDLFELLQRIAKQLPEVQALAKAARAVFDAEAQHPEKPERQLLELDRALEPFED